MDSGYRASRCRRYHGAAYGPHRFSLFTWTSARCCTGSCVKKRFPSTHAWEPLYIKGKAKNSKTQLIFFLVLFLHYLIPPVLLVNIGIRTIEHHTLLIRDEPRVASKPSVPHFSPPLPWTCGMSNLGVVAHFRIDLYTLRVNRYVVPKTKIWQIFVCLDKIHYICHNKLNLLYYMTNDKETMNKDNVSNEDLNSLLFDRPDWESCPDSSLDVGSDYVYHIGDDVLYSVSIRGHVLFNDGVTAILRVTNRYEECFFEILYYNEVRRFFPEFKDPDAHSQNEYLCLDVETESHLFERDPETDAIGTYHLDEHEQWVFTPVDLVRFRMERIKKLLVYLVAEKEKKEEEKQKSYDSTISIDLSDLAIDEMYQEYDQQHGNPNSDEELRHSLNRSIQWLRHRNCAILSAWRGKYNRKENDERNSTLQKKLRVFGYGVIRVKGCYAEIGRPLEKENSFLVFDLDDSEDFMQNIYELSEYNEQDCFLYKPVDEEVAYLIGTNDDYGKDRIDLAGFMRINSETADAFTKVSNGTISFQKNKA